LTGCGRATPTQVNGNIIGPDLVFRARGNGRAEDWKGMGETLVVRPGERITVQMQMTRSCQQQRPYKFNNPLLLQDGIQQALNAPAVDHVDLIMGQVDRSHPAGAPGYAVPNAAGSPGRRLSTNPSR